MIPSGPTFCASDRVLPVRDPQTVLLQKPARMGKRQGRRCTEGLAALLCAQRKDAFDTFSKKAFVVKGARCSALTAQVPANVCLIDFRKVSRQFANQRHLPCMLL